MSKTQRCLYCKGFFLPSRYRPQQRVCGLPDCQRRRRGDSRDKKLAADPEYREVVRDSRRKWWEEHPEYQKERRKANPAMVERNRQRQHVRDQQRRLLRLVRNNLVLELKHAASETWLVGPNLGRLDKNNLASAQVLILHPVVHPPAAPNHS